jgi:hypothetical protein
VGLAVVAAVGLLFVDRIPQLPGYHGFADQRTIWGIPHFGDVVSNAGFLLVGILGLKAVSGTPFDHPLDRLPYVVFFAGAIAVSLGSAYYHLAPGNFRLMWDRIPMTVAFAALAAAFTADRIDRRAGVVWLLPILALLGIGSVLYWYATQLQGNGDLRPYGFIQFGPMILLPLMCWLFPRRRYTHGRTLVWILALYGAAKTLETFDGPVADLISGLVSGHSLKHLAAAGAVYMVVPMLKGSRRTDFSPA